VPLQELRKTLGDKEIAIGNSLFQVLFVFENAPQYSPCLKDLICQQRDLSEGGPALVDLSLFLWDHPQGIQGHMVYDQNVFERPMIKHLIGNYYAVLEEVIENPNTPLRSFPFDIPPLEYLLPENRQQNLRATETNDILSPASTERETGPSTEEMVPAAIRREKLQARVAKLSQSKQEILNKKLKRVHRPPNN